MTLILALLACKAGGPVDGPADTHCQGVPPQPTDQASCYAKGDTGQSGDDGPEYGDTMYGTAGDDDDCKYHVTWSSTAVHEGSDVTFTVVATSLVDQKPVTGANIQLEGEIGNHPRPDPDATKTTENPPGTYTITPATFDQSGQWLIRFHLFENCYDNVPTSPHGHAAFYLDVP